MKSLVRTDNSDTASSGTSWPIEPGEFIVVVRAIQHDVRGRLPLAIDRHTSAARSQSGIGNVPGKLGKLISIPRQVGQILKFVLQQKLPLCLA